MYIIGAILSLVGLVLFLFYFFMGLPDRDGMLALFMMVAGLNNTKVEK